MKEQLLQLSDALSESVKRQRHLMDEIEKRDTDMGRNGDRGQGNTSSQTPNPHLHAKLDALQSNVWTQNGNPHLRAMWHPPMSPGKEEATGSTNKAVAPSFESMDKNGDGVIDRDEFDAAVNDQPTLMQRLKRGDGERETLSQRLEAIRSAPYGTSNTSSLEAIRSAPYGTSNTSSLKARPSPGSLPASASDYMYGDAQARREAARARILADQEVLPKDALGKLST